MKKLFYFIFKRKVIKRAKRFLLIKLKRETISNCAETILNLKNVLESPNVHFSPYFNTQNNLYSKIIELESQIKRLESEINQITKNN